MSSYIYIYGHVCVCVCMYIYICIYVCVCVCVYIYIYLWASLVARMVKNPPAMWRPGFDPWIGKIPWRRA